MTLNEATAKGLMQKLHKRFAEQPDSVWEVDKFRLQHYYNDPTADPPRIEGWDMYAKQTTWLRDTNVKLTARLTENAPKPEVSAPRKSSTLEKEASECELALVSMFDDARDMNGGVGIEAQLAWGMGVMSAPVLHWCLNDEIYAGLEKLDYDERDDFDEDETAAERARYVEDDYAPDSGRKKTKKYRETEDALMNRRAVQRALAGSPWTFRVYESTKFAYVENSDADKRKYGQFKYGMLVREVDLIDWIEGSPIEETQLRGGPSAPTDVEVGGSGDTWRPGADALDKKLVFYQLWDRHHIYEWVKGLPEEAKGKTREFRVVPNRQHMVPFALCPANITLSDSHILRYEPALTSMLRLKPEFDRLYMAYGILAESSAVPRYILVSKEGLPPLADEAGHFRMFGDHALAAKYAPEGYEPKRLGGDGVGGDFVKFLEWSQAFMEKAQPSTGHAEIESSTKPWTGRMMLTEANIEPAMYLDHMAACLKVAIKNIAEVNAAEDGPGDICFYPQGDNEKPLIVIKPEQWKGLRYDVAINKTSAVEQVTRMEHGRELMNDPLIGMTPLEFIRDYEGKPDAEDVWAEREAFKQAAPLITALAKMKTTKWAGSKFALTPDLRIVDATNTIVAPGEALMAAGQQPSAPMPQQMQQGAIPPGGGAGMGNPQIRMPSLAAQPPQNGAMPQQGLVG
jgi:hypothetical protein